ncbi:hypothetical protein CH373_16885 [Leptospira perolatii]|uniref:DUF1211 domain-containing protein n=1 Tax=Leptospira perolatii TaxID=2023191 RepID=A0A2M9ZIM1_9LEPT|nr:TMEM175 family protein [Leptospira perolatii]PJZ68464.1 hypothetical protein CH360_16115 [Leptospira perolatii]PJZ71908.1 hypothetical protein CH373_16885 [Leptospira perolatii]
MEKNRLEAFSDGIIAIIITIMVLELKVPHNPTWQNYIDAYPLFVSYALSFVFVGLYWSTHHHLFHRARTVNNRILWFNMLSLFWLSLIPFTTATMGASAFADITVAFYAAVLALVTLSYVILVQQLCRLHGADSAFSKAYTGHSKSYVTIGLNTSAAIISLIGFPKIAFIAICLIALIWFVPNFRIENNLKEEE